MSTVESVLRVLRREDDFWRVEGARLFAAVVRREEGAREEVRLVTAVITLVSLASSSDGVGDGDATTFRLRLGELCTGLETGTADADLRVPATEFRVTLAMLTVRFLIFS